MFTNSAPIRNMPLYGREVGRHVGLGALMLCTDLKPEEKERLLINFVQVGIDLGGLVRAGHEGWPAFGGHCSGRKLPIVLAGYLLNEEDMMNPSKASAKIQFQEDMQTIYGEGWTGAKALYGGHVGPEGMKDRLGWGAYEHLPPSKWQEHGGSSWQLGEGYRRCCTSCAWIGQALALKLLKMEKVWNHDAFFDYCDRWMTEQDDDFIYIMVRDCGYDWRGKAWAKQGSTWDKFVDEMWAKYRPGLAPAPVGWKSERPVPKFEGDPSKLPPPASKKSAAGTGD
jgi:hypothetical protein